MNFCLNLKKKKISIVEYSESCVEQIKKYENILKVWVYFDSEQFIKKAKKKQQEIDYKNFDKNPSLIGVPVGVKDIFNTSEMPTEFGSKVFKGYTPGNDARVVTSLVNDGCILAGKTSTAEFGVHNPPITVNPINNKRICGTSSTGSAVAVASFMVPVALGSQTAGSTSRPASYMGIYGFKPSFGLLPRTAVLKTTDTLDTVSILTRSVDDLKIMFESMRVYGRNYPIINRELKKNYRYDKLGKKWSIGILNGPKSELESKEVKTGLIRICKALEKNGCELDNYYMPKAFNDAHFYHQLIYCKCLSYYFKCEYKNNKDQLSSSFIEMIEYGNKISNKKYIEACEKQNRLQKIFEKSTKKFDLIICPSTPDEAPLINKIEPCDHNLIWALCRASTITIPGLKGSSGLPVGLQITGRRFDDYKVLKFSKFVDSCLN
jgi:Asp-tRNA(Asn)/Glu-tRNA(Gln) amidotransferase A subunit family amidase